MDVALAGMQGFFNPGRIIGYFNHHVPDRNDAGLLTGMDHEFEKDPARTTRPLTSQAMGI
ncbi:hypothetical protein AAGW05_15250 [Arthrobacter sp. LAPM80]|uniref:hypothetical protein n=1 Tax=Arthrobacter sp. LAPM80 TaxID=3141788 RepID=UPI00398B6553